MMKKQVDIETEKKAIQEPSLAGYHSVAFEDCSYHFGSHPCFYFYVWDGKNQ